MAKETQQLMTSDQYVVSKLLAAKEKLEHAENTIKSLESINSLLSKKSEEVNALLCLALKESKVVKEDDLISVYVNNSYLGLFRESEPDDKPKLQALAKLIEMVNSIPQREE